MPKTVTLKGPGVTKVDLGIKINLPSGCYGLLTGRSSFPTTHGATVIEGIIDPFYKDNLFVMIHPFNPSSRIILNKGESICQLIVQPYVPFINWEECLPEDESSKDEIKWIKNPQPDDTLKDVKIEQIISSTNCY